MIIRKIRRALNALLVGALGALGFSSCFVGMYGVPQVDVDVTGQVTDSLGNPLKGIVVTGRSRQGLRSESTDENGHFHILLEDEGFSSIILRDPSTADGCFMPDTVQIEYDKVKRTGSWTSKAEAHDLQLTMHEGTLDEYRATYDIIGTWTEVRVADEGGKPVWKPRTYTFAADGSVVCTERDSVRGTYTYEYRTLRTSLDAASLVYCDEQYYWRSWSQDGEAVLWTPSFVHFDEPSLRGYFHSCVITEEGYIEESVEPNYYSRREYKNGKVTYFSIEGRPTFTPDAEGSSTGTLTYSSYDGKKTKTLRVASLSRYGFAAGDAAPYQVFVRTE